MNDPIKTALSMSDCNTKYRRVCELMLRVEYLTPLWYSLKAEADRLENLGYHF